MSSRRSLVLLLAISPSIAWAQFNLPVPHVLPTERVLTEDIQTRFAQRKGIEAITKLMTANKDAQTAEYDSVVKNFCSDEQYPADKCTTALKTAALNARLHNDPKMNTVSRDLYLATFLPVIGTSRTAVASYLRRSGLDDGLDFASQFGASISDKEAYVTSNFVRGVLGATLFSADYAAVVTKSDTGPILDRQVVATDKGNLLRAINNGGTVVGRITMPMYASAGGTAAKAAGLTASVGFLGPIKETDTEKQRAIAAITAEAVSTVALRSIGGSYESTSQLLLGARAGYAQSEAPLKVNGTDKNIGYAQFLIGLRQNNSMAFSALITLTQRNFQPLVPRFFFNYSASH